MLLARLDAPLSALLPHRRHVVSTIPVILLEFFIVVNLPVRRNHARRLDAARWTLATHRALISDIYRGCYRLLRAWCSLDSPGLCIVHSALRSSSLVAWRCPRAPSLAPCSWPPFLYVMALLRGAEPAAKRFGAGVSQRPGSAGDVDPGGRSGVRRDSLWRASTCRRRRLAAISSRCCRGQDGSLLVIVGDVSGKGLKAAMTVSTIVGALRDFPAGVEPAEGLAHLNRVLYA